MVVQDEADGLQRQGERRFLDVRILACGFLALCCAAGCRSPRAHECEEVALWLEDLGRRFRQGAIADRDLWVATREGVSARRVRGTLAERYLTGESYDARIGAALCVDEGEDLGVRGLVALRQLEQEIPRLRARHANFAGRPWVGMPARFAESWAFGERMWVIDSPLGDSAAEHEAWQGLHWSADWNEPPRVVLEDCLALLRRAATDGRSDSIGVALLESRVGWMLRTGDGRTDCRARAREWRMALGRPPTEGVPYLTDPVMMLAVAVEADGLSTAA